MDALTQTDAVSFFHYLRSLRMTDNAYNANSYWLFLDATDDLFVAARQRVFTQVKEKVCELLT